MAMPQAHSRCSGAVAYLAQPSLDDLIMSGILYRRGGGDWISPADSGYANEDQLQAMIEEFPNLLPGITADSFVCREFNTDSGHIDNVIINATDGSITLVECKLARNPEVRRKVVGQIIDYAASMHKLSFEEFHKRWRDRGGADLTSVETGKGPLSLGVKTNLEGARFTLLLAVDEINEPLKDMVILVNKKTDATFRVALIELVRHSTGDTEILIPQTFGYEVLKPEVGEYEKRSPWSKDDFAAWLLAHEPSSLPKFEQFIELMENGGHRWGGTKSETPSGAICVRTTNGFRYPLVFHSFDFATIEARFVDFRKEPYVDELVSIFENIEEIDVSAIRNKDYGAKPKIAVSRLNDPMLTASLLALCDRVSKADLKI